MCVVATDPAGDVDTAFVQEYDPALDITALRMSASSDALTVEWQVVDLSFAHPLAATTQVWQAYWNEPGTGKQVLLRPERDAITGEIWVDYWDTVDGQYDPIVPAFDLASNTIRVEIPRSAVQAADGQTLTNIYTLSLHYPIIIGGDNREEQEAQFARPSFTLGAPC